MNLQGRMTKRGTQLRTAALLGSTALTLVRAAAGSGETAEDAVVLAEEKQVLPLGRAYASGNELLLPVTLVAAQADAPYTLTEVGVYALDDGEETLYCVYRADETLEITPESTLSIRFELTEIFDDVEQVTASPAGVITRGDLGVAGGPAKLDEVDGTVSMSQLPFTFGTEDLTAGESALESGTLHFVYE